jgi:hypothetical protein
VYPNQTQQQPPAPQPHDDCPDPNPDFTRYRVAAAVAAERARLYVADIPDVQQRYDRLAGAQTRFADAKTAQRTAFEELKQRVERVASALNRDLTDADRQHLKTCWDQLNQETAPPTTVTNCADVDGLDCDHLPDDDARLRSLATLADTCVQRSNTEFDDLANLPEALAPLITDLLTKATQLEQDICATRSDLPRSYIEYLGLQHSFDRLDGAWTTPTTYGCRLKLSFQILRHRHVVAICLKVERFRRDREIELKEEARKAKQANLIDLVLECARPKPSGGQQGESSQPPQYQYRSSQSTGS